MNELFNCDDRTKLNHMVNLLANDDMGQEKVQGIKKLQQRSKKSIGMATGGILGSVIPGVGSLLGALIGYSLADSQWVAAKVDQWLAR
ncbi:MAG: hypothetical protein HQL90_03190 [Magnetococcales bacterium]|nr:hypothetical protein [Magnetococcales bacterium]